MKEMNAELLRQKMECDNYDTEAKNLSESEIFASCGEMVKRNVLMMKERIFLLREYVGNEEGKLRKEIRLVLDEGEKTCLEATRAFYCHALQELIEIEEIFEEHFIQMKLDQLEELRNRLLPATNLSWEIIPDIFDKATVEKCQIIDFCDCPGMEKTSQRESTPSTVALTKFDETDQKFFQELFALRANLFKLPKSEKEPLDVENIIECPSDSKAVRFRMNKDFIQIVEKTDSFVIPNVKEELKKIVSLKFVDFEFRNNKIWTRLLDSHGNQLRSKWIFIVQPQIEKILKIRIIPILNLNPHEVFKLLLNIEENGLNFVLTKDRLVSLLSNFENESGYLTSWSLQFKTVEGKKVAATIIQALWRGYRIRKLLLNGQMVYIAASVIWSNWIFLKKRREMHANYYKRMFHSLNRICELTESLAQDFDNFIKRPHVILLVSSYGCPLDIRRTFHPKALSVFQNIMGLRMSLGRNRMSKIIYILPVTPTQDLLQMYRDVMNSVVPKYSKIKRISFIAPSQIRTFSRRPANLSRTLHCSEDTLNVIKKRIAGKPTYLLPWILDECDVKIAGDLNIPLLSPNIELQKKLLNASLTFELIEELHLPHPPHSIDIKDYTRLCSELAELIILYPEVCIWLIKLNAGESSRHCANFVISHISVPFMPALRREREKLGKAWDSNAEIRENYLQILQNHLPQVVSSLIRLPRAYGNWKQFYSHLEQFGCLLQASPKVDKSEIIVVTLFVPGKNSEKRPKWTGTAKKLDFECNFPTVVYIIPQTFLDNSILKPIVNKFAQALQNQGYFGYLAVECCCNSLHHIRKRKVQIIDVYPYYGDCQHYVDWLKFAIDGTYSQTNNLFTTDVKVLTPFVSTTLPKWDETTKRYAVAISQLYHKNMHRYKWTELKILLEKEKISYEKNCKEGSHFLMHDGVLETEGSLITISPNIPVALSKIYGDLKQLNRLFTESNYEPESNLRLLANYFRKLSMKYHENLYCEKKVI
ncbi:IQ motif-containing protein H-like [Prorops nasuta]|uniref:IQ motif-containing protein H-like n=1 Tax=Prorops nasuta TaxID=863751 RepID=UPI0034CD2FC6